MLRKIHTEIYKKPKKKKKTEKKRTKIPLRNYSYQLISMLQFFFKLFLSNRTEKGSPYMDYKYKTFNIRRIRTRPNKDVKTRQSRQLVVDIQSSLCEDKLRIKRTVMV